MFNILENKGHNSIRLEMKIIIYKVNYFELKIVFFYRDLKQVSNVNMMR